MMPTVDQAMPVLEFAKCSQMAISQYIYFATMPNTNTVFILAGVTESLEVLIFLDGQWRFNDDEA